MHTRHRLNRRSFLLGMPAVLAGAAAPLDVAYAGSMTSVMEGPIKRAAASELGLELRGRAQGASGLAQLIAGGSIRPDVFISVTRSPMDVVVKAGKAEHPEPVARTEMVIAYNPKSEFAARFPKEPWWRVLESPGLRFGRTDPVTDPQGRNIIFVMRLAESYYHQPDLAKRILGEEINTRQIFTEPSVQARLQGGELDAASAYKIQPAAFHLPYVTLPVEINLGGEQRSAEYRRVSLQVNGKTYQPEPLVYYAAALKESENAARAGRFVAWLREESARKILREFGYDSV